jgi:hypothetical protein
MTEVTIVFGVPVLLEDISDSGSSERRVGIRNVLIESS